MIESINYAHLLASRVGAELTDLTVSGATTDTILKTSQRTVRGLHPDRVQPG